jgi:hypothetical protein
MVTKLPGQIVTMMASRDWRIHHYLWHQVRNGWLFFDAPTQEAIRVLGWEPPRPARRPGANGQPETALDNDSGEDFLYMHRNMIEAVNAELARGGDPGYPAVNGWQQVPRPNDLDYPVPAAWESGDADLDDYLRTVKSESTFQNSFVPWENDYTDLQKLAAWSLGELGARLEFTIHNQMHMRWCSAPGELGIRPDADAAHPESIDEKWDQPVYNWLGDTYSSHVNAVFWKVHGWIDDRIGDWKQAHEILGEIPWKGKWVGKSMSQAAAHSFLSAFAAHVGDDHHGGKHGSLAEMEKLVALIARTGHFCHFYDDVSLGTAVAASR